MEEARQTDAKQFLQAYLAMKQPTTTHLFCTKRVFDFLVGLIKY